MRIDSAPWHSWCSPPQPPATPFPLFCDLSSAQRGKYSPGSMVISPELVKSYLRVQFNTTLHGGGLPFTIWQPLNIVAQETSG